jgi:hypothetical protein
MQNYLRLFVVQTKRNIFMTTGINTQSRKLPMLYTFSPVSNLTECQLDA